MTMKPLNTLLIALLITGATSTEAQTSTGPKAAPAKADKATAAPIKPTAAKPGTSPATTSTPATSAQDAADPILIKGATITVRASEFELEKKNVPADQRIDLFTDMNRIQRTLERLALNKLLMAELKKAGYDKRPDVVEELTYTMNQKLASMYVNHLNAETKLPDFEPLMKERYIVEKEKYAQPERVRVQHILVSTKSRSKDDAKKRAEEVRAKALAGADFTALAREYSDDPSVRRNGGDLGFVGRDSVVPPFAKAAFALQKTGDISDVVETEYGLHVIRFEDRKAAQIPPYEDLRKTFLEDAARDYRASAMRNYFSDLMEKEQPLANMDEVAKLLVNPQSEELKNINDRIQKEIRDTNQRPARRQQ
jgi:peptidyl-prolyl cis-trans isomerase C